jgi:hypothetical protein
MRNQRTERRITREDIKALAEVIASNIVAWCMYQSDSPPIGCVMYYINQADLYDIDMHVPKEYEKLYKRILRSHRKTNMLIRAVKSRLRKAVPKMKKNPRYWRVPEY